MIPPAIMDKSLVTIKPIEVNTHTHMLIRGSLRQTIKMIHCSAGVRADENKLNREDNKAAVR